MSAHTPGPWHLVDGAHQRRFMPDDLVEIAASPSGLGFIACLYRHNWPDGTDAANARLIEAAPEMHHALAEIVGAAVTDSEHCSFCWADLTNHAGGCPIGWAVKVLAKVGGSRR